MHILRLSEALDIQCKQNICEQVVINAGALVLLSIGFQQLLQFIGGRYYFSIILVSARHLFAEKLSKIKIKISEMFKVSIVLLLFFVFSSCTIRSNFKTCKQSSFCSTNRFKGISQKKFFLISE